MPELPPSPVEYAAFRQQCLENTTVEEVRKNVVFYHTRIVARKSKLILGTYTAAVRAVRIQELLLIVLIS